MPFFPKELRFFGFCIPHESVLQTIESRSNWSFCWKRVLRHVESGSGIKQDSVNGRVRTQMFDGMGRRRSLNMTRHRLGISLLLSLIPASNLVQYS
jgi:hypothetical protein